MPGSEVQVVMLDKFASVGPAPDGKHVFVACNVSGRQDFIAVPKEEIMNLVMALMTGLNERDDVDRTQDVIRLIPTESFEIGADDAGKGLLRMAVKGGGRFDFDLQPSMVEVIRDTFLKEMPADPASSRH